MPFSVRACMWRALSTLFAYLSGALMDLVHGLGAGFSLALTLCQHTHQPATVDTPTGASLPPTDTPGPTSSSSAASSQSPPSATRRTLLMAYAQPMKIALAITITALFVVVPQLRYDQMQNGLWATVCIAFIRQDNTSSSFLTGYQVRRFHLTQPLPHPHTLFFILART